jgi:hypothetical protein
VPSESEQNPRGESADIKLVRSESIFSISIRGSTIAAEEEEEERRRERRSLARSDRILGAIAAMTRGDRCSG